MSERTYLFFDTETTGIPRNYKAPASDLANWPRLVQLAWMITDDQANELASAQHIVKPEGFAIPRDAARIHGITTEMAARDGRDLKSVRACARCYFELRRLLVMR